MALETNEKYALKKIDRRMKTFLEWVSILEARGEPTRLNLYTMYSVLRDNNGVVPARVPSVDLDHLRRCLNAGLLEAGEGGFLPTEKGLAAMAEFHKGLLRSNPDTPTPGWLGGLGPSGDRPQIP